MIKLINDDFLKADFSSAPPINLVITSPAYNVGILYDKHDDTMTYDDYLIWSQKWIEKCFSLMAEDGRICINIPFSCNPYHANKIKGEDKIVYPLSADITKICQAVGFKYWRTIVWGKLGSSKTCWGSWRSARCPIVIDPNESILVFYKTQWKRKTTGTSTISGKEFMIYIKNLWNISAETKSNHPAPFPVELPSSCIKMFSYKEDTIMDCFLGSGTSGEAAVRLGRNFVGVEISKDYFNMAKERIEAAELQTSLIKQVMPILPIDPKEDVADIW